MILTGFADEAGASLEVQIRATRALGWRYIECRKVGSQLLGTMSDAEFAAVEAALAEAGVRINCYGSAIANWSCHPRSEADFTRSRNELLTAIPRLHRLGVRLVRGMSFLAVSDEEPDSPELEGLIFRKVRELVSLCADAGLVYGHENCRNYGGLSHRHTLRLLEAVNPSHFTLIYDTGNPCFSYRHVGAKPYSLQSSWEFYAQVRDHISYVHIKDATAIPRDDGAPPERVFTYPGEGCGDVRAIVVDLMRRGYRGGFSMEPHLAGFFRTPEMDEAAFAQVKFDTYVEYGRRFMRLLQECGGPACPDPQAPAEAWLQD